MKELNILIDEVRQTQRDALRQANLLPKVRAGVESAELRRWPALGRWVWASTALAGAATASVLLLRPAPLSVAVGDARVHSGAGALIEAPAAAPLPVHFGDGTAVALAPRARLAVASVDAHGATLVLERGRMDLGVVHRKEARWSVRAGRYEVAVTGTRFGVSFDPDSDAVTVEMQAGSVLVRGPGMRAATPLGAGDTLHAFGRTGQIDIARAGVGSTGASAAGAGSTIATAAAAPAPAGEEAPAPEGPPAAQAQPLAMPAPGSALHVVPPHAARALDRALDHDHQDRNQKLTWLDYFRAARYPEALAAAERAGFSSLCVRLEGKDLVSLGDAARLAGNPARAEQAYVEARRRSKRIDRSVFGLGMVEFDLRHSYHSAAEWFGQYLEAYPRGPLASEAAGRLMESWYRVGDMDQARKAAQSYLKQYPTGPHAALARQISGS
jgi:hypothetical protein